MSNIKYQGHIENYLYQFYDRLKGKKILLAVSGGADSMALLAASRRPLVSLGIEFLAAYIHHGNATNDNFRNQSYLFVKDFCEKNKIIFTSNVEALDRVKFMIDSDESSLRNFRYDELKKISNREGCDVLATAHHQDDLLETRLIQLLRGTGVQGFISMENEREELIRPLLKVPKNDLINYLSQQKVNYLDDPSNLDLNFLRNFIRSEWLPSIEKKRSGSVAALSRSFDLIVDELRQNSSRYKNFSDRFLDRKSLFSLDKNEQGKVVASFLKLNGVLSFSQSQIEEVLKRLDTDQRSIRFNVAGFEWILEKDLVSLVAKE